MKNVLGALLTLLFMACSSATQGPQAVGGITPQQSTSLADHKGGSSTPIQHVVVIMQENRTFDNLFYGFPGARFAKHGIGHGVHYKREAIPLTWRWDITHNHSQFLEDFDGGKGDGFDNQIRGFSSGSGCMDPRNHPSCWIFWPGKSIKKMAFSYVQQSDVQPYWTMAQQYALGDETFSSNNDDSFTAHQYMIAGQAGHASEVPNFAPYGCDSRKNNRVETLVYGAANPPVFSPATGHEIVGPYPCFTYETAADLLDAASVSWRYYVVTPVNSSFSAFDAIENVRDGADWKNVVPNTDIFSDVTNGTLRQVSWVTPSGPNSDHAGPNSGSGGPDWVASIVNAIGESSYWNSTAIIVMWDDWGGWYDHVIPKQYPDPVTNAYEGLGFRIPLIVVSPYAKAGYISHKRHELASSLKFIEATFGLPSLGGADARADAFADIFDYTQAPIPFQPIPTHRNARYFIEHPSTAPADDY
jgi:phospholipase C